MTNINLDAKIMALFEKIKEAHHVGLKQYERTRSLLSSPVYLLVRAINEVVPGTVDNVPSHPNPKSFFYQAPLDYIRGFYTKLRE